ncbi:MAG: hypothetical protein AMXMBFR58_37440 [Phycisphaerae bacterium]
MPRPDPTAPKAGQSALFDAVELVAERRTGQVLRGRHSIAMDTAIDAARSAEVVGDIDAGLTTVLRAGAWALDSMEASTHHYGPAKLIPALTEALNAAHMTPEARKTETDNAIHDLLAELAGADEEAAGDDAALSDAPQ